METTARPPSPSPESDSTPSLSLVTRTVAVFARPGQAWGGLQRKPHWWFPLLATVLVAMLGTAAVYERAVVPMIAAQFAAKVESGEMTQAMADQVVEQMAGPGPMALNLASMLVVLPVITLLTALLPWLGTSFLVGRRLRYADAFAVTCWAGLVGIPAQLLTYGLAWASGSMEGVHIGFGILLPVTEEPSRLLHGLGTFLDQGIGPFAVWYVAVMALGAAALSGAPARRVFATLGGLWVVVMAVYAVLSGLFGRGV